MSAETGTLAVLAGAGRPGAPRVEIRDWRLRLVARMRSGEELELAPGRYVARVARPGGEEEIGSVVVAPGERATVELGREGAAFDAAVLAPRTGALRSAAPRRGPAAHWSLRLVSARTGRPVEPAPALHIEGADVTIEPRGEAEPLFAQLAMPGAIPHNVALPIGEGDECRLRLQGERPAAVAPDGELAGLLAAYLVAGQLLEAADLADSAEALLAGKVRDPIGAAIGAYALLRLGRDEQLHDWPENLAAWFPWLPDGAVIAGEAAARRGEEGRARRHLADAVQRGIPLFGEGLSLLSLRLAQGWVDGERARRVLALGPYVELGRLTVALPGQDPTDPARTQAPLDDLPAAAGWHMLRPGEDG